jgi:hypothetical protein
MRQHQFVPNFVAGNDRFMNYGEISPGTLSKLSPPLPSVASLFLVITIIVSSGEDWASLINQRETWADKNIKVFLNFVN